MGGEHHSSKLFQREFEGVAELYSEAERPLHHTRIPKQELLAVVCSGTD
jgi:hypothetical protein